MKLVIYRCENMIKHEWRATFVKLIAARFPHTFLAGGQGEFSIKSGVQHVGFKSRLLRAGAYRGLACKYRKWRRESSNYAARSKPCLLARSTPSEHFIDALPS